MILLSEHSADDRNIAAALTALRDAGIQASSRESHEACCVVLFSREEITALSDRRAGNLSDEQKSEFAAFAKGSLYDGIVSDGFERLGYLFEDWCGEAKVKRAPAE